MEKAYVDRRGYPPLRTTFSQLPPPPQLQHQGSVLARLFNSMAARTGLLSPTESRHVHGNGSAGPMSSRTASWLFSRSRSPGARLRRILLVLACAVLLTTGLMRLANASHGEDARASLLSEGRHALHAVHVVNGGTRRLTWNSWTDDAAQTATAPAPGVEGGDGSRQKEQIQLTTTESAPDEDPWAAGRPATVASTITTEVCVSFPELGGLDHDSTTLLQHVPAKIWQIYLDFHLRAIPMIYLQSWILNSPSFAYTVLDKTGALSLVGRLATMALDGAWRVPLYPNPLQKTDEKTAGHRGSNSDSSPSGHPLRAALSDLSFARDVLPQYTAMPRRVLRADFLRYLVLALEGGVYSDVDTQLIKPVRDWVPPAFRDRTRLIVGLEADASPPIPGTTYEVQFCQWTLASAPDHPTMWTMLDRILARVRAIQDGAVPARITATEDVEEIERAEKEETAGHQQNQGKPHQHDQTNTRRRKRVPKMKDYHKLSDTDVLEITGPAAWTEVVFEHLNAVAGDGVGRDRITWQNLTGMTKPRLYGDTLVLPIDGFATGVPHSHASSQKTDQTLITHRFEGGWREDKG